MIRLYCIPHAGEQLQEEHDGAGAQSDAEHAQERLDLAHAQHGVLRGRFGPSLPEARWRIRLVSLFTQRHTHWQRDVRRASIAEEYLPA